MRLPGLMKCELLPELLGDLSHMWMFWSWSLRRSIHLDFPLLPPTCLHMAFGNSLLLRLPIPSEMELSSQTLASSGPRLTFSSWTQDGLIHPGVPLDKILLRIKLLCPLYSSSHRTPLRSSWSLFSQPRTWQYANTFYSVSTCQHKCSCTPQIALPTISFSGNS